MIKRNQKGFTFIELMIAVGIMAIITAIGAPRYLAYKERISVKTAGRELMERINEARSLAMKNEEEVRVVFQTMDGHLGYRVEKGTGSNTEILYKVNIYDRYQRAQFVGVGSGDVIVIAPSGEVDTGQTSGITPTTMNDPPEVVSYYKIIVQRAGGSDYVYEVRIYETGKTEFVKTAG